MDLILWRHAEAEDGERDLERRLTKKGRDQAARVGIWLNVHLPPTTSVLASPAERTLETARAVGRPFKTVAALAPGASVAAVLAAAHWPNARDPVLVVGHQPTLGGVVSFLIAGHEDYWTVSKGAVWWLSNRDRGGHTAVAVRLVIGPDFL